MQHLKLLCFASFICFAGRVSKQNLSERQIEIIVGTIMGDSSLTYQPNAITPRLQCRHSVVQADYMNWLKNELGFLISKQGLHYQEPDGFSSNKKMHLQTLVHPFFVTLHNESYEKYVDSNNKIRYKKVVTQAFLNRLSLLSIAVWWCDDGNLNADNQQGVLCTNSFTLEEHNLLIKWFKERWNVTTRAQKILPHKDPNINANPEITYRLAFCKRKDFVPFLLQLLPYCPCEAMLYKFCINYRDRNEQQSWIAKMKKAAPQFAAAIDQHYAKS